MAVTWITLGASVSAILANAYLFFAAAPDAGSARFFTFWAASPYLAHCGLAWMLRRHLAASRLGWAGTVAAGLFTLGVFYSDLQPIIAARAEGTRPPMNCAGPLLELGLPVLQWLFVGLLGGVASLTESTMLFTGE